jgi:outer membrane protein OmpA-like peptidoglycan-associated protein
MSFRRAGPLSGVSDRRAPVHSRGILNAGAESHMAHASVRARPGHNSLAYLFSSQPHNRKGGNSSPPDDYKAANRTYLTPDGDAAHPVEWEDVEGLVAQIFFVTNKSTIDPYAVSTLSAIYERYGGLLAEPPQARKSPAVRMRFVGYADKRGEEAANLELGNQRAETVAQVFSPLRYSGNYSQGIVSMGEAEKPQIILDNNGPVSWQLNPFRRVDIYARPILKSRELKTTSSASWGKYWAIRQLYNVGVSGDAGPASLGGTVGRLEIVDRLRHLAQTFLWYGGGGSSPAPHEYPIWGSVSLSPTDWEYFDLDKRLELNDFAGRAAHRGWGVAAGYGYAADKYMFYAPRKKLGHDIVVEFADLGWSKQAILGYGVEYGRVSARYEPYEVSADYHNGEELAEVPRVLVY